MMPSPDPAPVRRTLAVYTLWRIAFAVAVFAACLAGGLDTPLSLVIAFLVSSIASYLLLRGQRDALTAALLARRQTKLDARARRRAALDEPPSAGAG